ncbi:MAG: repeat-containing protein [Paenibacillus sp.]|jgi:hypothetical protein|nr:repeat-containing protein [Paenibacillus sp.]
MHSNAQQLYGQTLTEVSRAGIGACINATMNGSFLYAIQNNEREPSRLPEDQGEGCLYILSCEAPGQPAVVGKLQGLGNARQIAVQGNLALVTARDDGLFLIDVGDPASPRLLAHYNTIEHATGIAIYGTLALVTCRQYGVEIIDIANPQKPLHIATVRVGEAQSVDACDGFLYAGVWGGSEVVICDIRIPEQPKIVSRVELDGYGDGVFVRDGICYAATGHNSRGMKERSAEDPHYGTGSGLEIYDVRDPHNPRLLSRLKLKERYYVHIFDMWSVQVAGRYAYLAHTFNGVFVIDVGNPERPEFVAHINFPIYPGDSNYRNVMSTLGRGKAGVNTVMLPFDPEQVIHSPVGGLAVGTDYIYAAGGYTDLHAVYAPGLASPVRQADQRGSATTEDGCGRSAHSSHENQPNKHAVTLNPFDIPGLQTYRPEGQVYAVAQAGRIVYAACGAAGIHVVDLEERPQCLAVYATNGFATDIKQFGNLLFVAEGIGGLSIWNAARDRLQLISRYAAGKQSVRQVMLSDDGRYAVLHVGGLSIQIVHVADVTEPRLALTESFPPGLIYGRQICSGLAEGRYAGCFWHSKTINWYDLAGEEPIRMPWTQDCLVLSDGLTVTPHGVLATYKGGYIVFDPRFDGELDDLARYRIPGIKLSGKPTVSGDVLFVANRLYGDVAVLDISAVHEPKLLKTFKLAGNPDLITCSNGRVIIPAGYQGMLVFPLEML